MADISVELTLGYTNTDFTRPFSIGGVSASALSGIVDNVKAVNASLTAGTDGGLADFFLADDYDASDTDNVIGKLNAITAVKSISVAEDVIFSIA